MSHDDKRDDSSDARATRRSLFAVPPTLKRVFDKFPLTIYPTNELPSRADNPKDKNVLYTFTTREDARVGRPSFNPSCLKWQTYMRITRVEFATAPSNNHASPSGSLPFVIPAPSRTGQIAIPVRTLRKWIARESPKDCHILESKDVRNEAYSSLLDGRIRLAWLYQLYLLPANSSVMNRLYVAPCSSNLFVQMYTSRQLRQAADAEVRKTTSRVVLDTELLREAEEAFSALSTLLSNKSWFFEDTISLFDASVFAYTHLLLDQDLMQWEDNPLGEILKKHENLVAHRDRILNAYYMY